MQQVSLSINIGNKTRLLTQTQDLKFNKEILAAAEELPTLLVHADNSV